MEPKSRYSLIALSATSVFVLLLSFFFPGELPKSLQQQQPVIAEGETTAPETVEQNSSDNLQKINLQMYDLNENAATSMKLARSLREISGLAASSNNTVWAHNDETGVIYSLDTNNGSIRSSFQLSLNGKLIRDDLEGIAVAEDHMYVINSNGKIYEFKSAGNGEMANCKIYPTSLVVDWEIEGLAYDSSIRSLVIISKNPLTAKASGKVGIFFWSLDKRSLILDETIYVPIREFAQKIGQKKFQPSGIEYHAESGHYLLVAARQHALAEITPQGEVLTVKKLSSKLHRQMEGITFSSDMGLVISDEGGNKAGRLTLYAMK